MSRIIHIARRRLCDVFLFFSFFFALEISILERVVTRDRQVQLIAGYYLIKTLGGTILIVTLNCNSKED